MSEQSARATIDASLSERDFQAMILEVASLTGWIAYHVPDSRRVTASGYPDLTLLHPAKHRFLIREVKTQRGRIRPEQVLWLDAMAASGIDAGVWRPADWESILTTLSA